MKKPKQTAMTVITAPTVAEEAKQLMESVMAEKVYGVKQGAQFVKTGVLIQQLKKKLGIGQGGDRKSPQYQSSVERNLDLDNVLALVGLSKTAAWRREKMAEEAGDRLPIILAVLEGDVPITMLPDAAKVKLNAALDALTECKTPQQLMWDWGIEKKRLKGGDTSLSDTNQIKQWCGEYHPEMPVKECMALPGKLKKEYRQWAANQPVPSPDYDAMIDSHIEALDVIVGDSASRNGCSLAKLRQMDATAEALKRAVSAALSGRKNKDQQ